MCDRIHILIVEDEKPMADLMERLVKPLLSHFAGSQVTVAHKLVDALLTVRAYNAPDIVLLDLTLPDSDIENTMNHIDEIDSRCDGPRFRDTRPTLTRTRCRVEQRHRHRSQTPPQA